MQKQHIKELTNEEFEKLGQLPVYGLKYRNLRNFTSFSEKEKDEQSKNQQSFLDI